MFVKSWDPRLSKIEVPAILHKCWQNKSGQRAGEARAPKRENRGAMTSVLKWLLDFLSREEFATRDFPARSGAAFCGVPKSPLLRNGRGHLAKCKRPWASIAPKPLAIIRGKIMSYVSETSACIKRVPWFRLHIITTFYARQVFFVSFFENFLKSPKNSLQKSK